MGAWNEDIFGNDAACDWLFGFLENPDIDLIKIQIEGVLKKDDFIDSHQGSLCLAACEIVARLCGNWGLRDAYTEKLDEWIETSSLDVSKRLQIKARDAVRKISSKDSELKGLWIDDERWKLVIENLIERLN